MSGTESRVWHRLRRKQLNGHRFRRQVPIGPYHVDFVCLKARLAIEIDGAGHEEEKRDMRKTQCLESQGFKVLRISASNTDQDLDAVINWIWAELDNLVSLHPNPPRRAGRKTSQTW
jgi:very-short-patch-repair endonuclease